MAILALWSPGGTFGPQKGETHMLDPWVSVNRIRRMLTFWRCFTLVSLAGLFWTAFDGLGLFAVLMWVGNVAIGVVMCFFNARHLNQAIVWARLKDQFKGLGE